MEDYKKRYDDLIERLRKAKNDNDYCDERYCCVIDELAPDVKESEDERIRKALLTYFSDEDESYDGIPYPNICSWIEKQDEKDKEILILKDQIESLHAAIKAIKETHKIEIEKQGEQKSAWSEEDEKMIRGLIAICDEWTTSHSFYPIENYDMEKLKNWLKSFKERVQPQPKQEWSKEDETMATNIIIMLKEGASLHFNKNDIAKGVDWLKSLKLQDKWKPSDEQMKFLWKYAEQNNYDGTILTSLFNDLKKLKE